MKKHLGIIIFLAIIISGCGISESKYQDLKDENEDLKAELSKYKKKIKLLKETSSKALKNIGKMGIENRKEGKSNSPTKARGNKHVSWYPNGNVKDEVWVNENEDWHGKYSVYYENGAKKELGNYKNGKKDGKWIKWDKNGKVLSEITYENGVKK